MKREILLLATVVMLCQAGLKAQTKKGQSLVGVTTALNLAEFGYGTSPSIMRIGSSTFKTKSNADGFEEDDPSKAFGFSISPKVGYLFSENLALGLDLVLSYSSQKPGGDSDYKSSNTIMCIGPFARYYIPGEKVYPFFELGTTIGSAKDKSTYNGDTDEFTTGIFTYHGGFGLAIPIGEKVTFDVLAGYTSSTLKDKEDNEDNWRYVLGTLDIRLGFVVYLGKTE
ncbi:outer membrane beta-barrel protein [Bacteroidota bacterium]